MRLTVPILSEWLYISRLCSLAQLGHSSFRFISFLELSRHWCVALQFTFILWCAGSLDGFHPPYLMQLLPTNCTIKHSFTVSYEGYDFVCNGCALSVRPFWALIYKPENLFWNAGYHRTFICALPWSITQVAFQRNCVRPSNKLGTKCL